MSARTTRHVHHWRIAESADVTHRFPAVCKHCGAEKAFADEDALYMSGNQGGRFGDSRGQHHRPMREIGINPASSERYRTQKDGG